MEEYIKTLLDQIRCKKARNLVESEIRNHLEDQIADNKSNGLSEEKAVSEAVKDMGDPVEAGVSLDRIHKPQISWSMIIVMTVISLTSIFLHVMIGLETHEVNRIFSGDYIRDSIIHICLGYGIMLFVLFVDYSMLAKYVKVIAVVFLVIMYLGSCFGPHVVARLFFRVGGISICPYFLLLLLVPIYGALLYQYHGTDWSGILKAMLWMLVIVWIASKNARFLIIYWSTVLLLPIWGIPIGYQLGFLNDYYVLRLREVFEIGAPQEYEYVRNQIRVFLEASQLMGSSGKDVVAYIPEYNSSYILTFLYSNYGKGIAFLVCIVLAFLVIKSFQISYHQKNQLGMIMGLGIILSINRYKNLLPMHLPVMSKISLTIKVNYNK